MVDSPENIFLEFVRRFREGDVEGLVALYREDACVYFQPDVPSVGREAIRASLIAMLEAKPDFSAASQRNTIVVGDLALTSASFGGKSFTAEIAQRQPGGGWLWVIDHPFFSRPLCAE
jgi:ketosteroid isomerase-like protein